jgi:hypothetical protein
MVVEIRVEKIVGMEWAVGCDDGELLGNTILELIRIGNAPIHLMFENIRSCSSAFLSSVVDILIDNGIEEDELPKLICIPDDKKRQFLFNCNVRECYDYRRRPQFHDRITQEVMDEYD